MELARVVATRHLEREVTDRAKMVQVKRRSEIDTPASRVMKANVALLRTRSISIDMEGFWYGFRGRSAAKHGGMLTKLFCDSCLES